MVNVVWPGCNLDNQYLGFLASPDPPGVLFSIGARGRFRYHGTTAYQPDPRSDAKRVTDGVFNGEVLNSKTIALNLGLQRLDDPGCTLTLAGKHNGFAITLHFSHHFSGWG